MMLLSGSLARDVEISQCYKVNPTFGQKRPVESVTAELWLHSADLRGIADSGCRELCVQTEEKQGRNAARLNSRGGEQQIERSRLDRWTETNFYLPFFVFLLQSSTFITSRCCSAAFVMMKQQRLYVIVALIGCGHRELSIYQSPLVI